MTDPTATDTATPAAPFMSQRRAVEPEWIDYNGHLNMAYYNVLFDRGLEDPFDVIGINLAYTRERRLTTYTAELHVCYVRELHVGNETVCAVRILDHDDKRMHVFIEMFHVDGWLAATAELLVLHIDMNGPKVVPFPPDILARIKAMHAEHARLPTPARAGRTVGIRRKTPA